MRSPGGLDGVDCVRVCNLCLRHARIDRPRLRPECRQLGRNPADQADVADALSDSRLRFKLEARRTAAIGPRRWLSCLAIALLPLTLVIASWASGQLWLVWLAIPFALLAVSIAAWNASHVSRRATAPAVTDSPIPAPPESSPAACIGLAVAD